jgi:hypothetical protein
MWCYKGKSRCGSAQTTSLETVKSVAAPLTRLSCIHSLVRLRALTDFMPRSCSGQCCCCIDIVEKTYTSADGFAATNTLRVASVRSSHLGKSMLRSLSQRASTSLRASHAAQTSRFYSGMAAAASAQPGLHEAGLRCMCYPLTC